MKKLFCSVVLCLMGMTSFAQTATMPTLILFPDDRWMDQHGFVDIADGDGKNNRLFRYNDAFVENTEIGTAITAVQAVFEERGFKHKDLPNLLKQQDRRRGMEMARKADGKGTQGSNMKRILQQANPDIRVDLFYSVKPYGFRKDIHFELKAVDAYTMEQVSSCQGDIVGTADPLELALRKVIAGKSEEFCEKMVNYFLDLRDNGRKVMLYFMVPDGTEVDLTNDEVPGQGKVYQDYLLDWIQEHSVNQSGTTSMADATEVDFEDVRVPFFNDLGKPTDTRQWARQIATQLKNDAGITVKIDPDSGLGQVTFIVEAE